MIEVQTPEPDPIEAAIEDWCEHADLYRDGVKVQADINLLGSNKVIGKAWAKAIRNHLDAGDHSRDALAIFLVTTEASQYVRAWSQAPAIAEGLLVMLRERELL